MQNVHRFFLVLLFFVSWGMADESSFKYTDKISVPGAKALKIEFLAPTISQQATFSFVDNQGIEIFQFSGNSLSNNKILVLDDTIYLNLKDVAEKNKPLYKYSVTPIYRSHFAIASVDYTKAFGLTSRDLKDELYNKVKGHTSLGYRPAREKMFGEIDNRSGYVNCVYTGKVVKTTKIPDPAIMNCEHTWPKSKGAQSEPALSDLHHLFPTDSYSNSKRSSYPFGTVTKATWSEGGSSLGRDAGGYTVFMPRYQHRGDVARSMFYFSIRYRKSIPGYEEKVLRAWHRDDPVDQKELRRNDDISRYQRNRNPFVDQPEFVDAISDF